MADARDDVLANIRRSLGATGHEAPRLQAVAQRLAGRPRGVIPRRGAGDQAARLGMFKAMAESANSSVSVVASLDDVPAEAARHLRQQNLPASLRMGADAALAAMPWASTALDISHGASAGDDLNAISHAFAGVAESGTLVMLSGPDNPTTLNFLPDNHIIVLRAADLLGSYEDAWQRLRQAGVATEQTGAVPASAATDTPMPRVVNMITGPSRSGDIDRTLLLGAHGPRSLHVIIVAE